MLATVYRIKAPGGAVYCSHPVKFTKNKTGVKLQEWHIENALKHNKFTHCLDNLCALQQGIWIIECETYFVGFSNDFAILDNNKQSLNVSKYNFPNYAVQRLNGGGHHTYCN